MFDYFLPILVFLATCSLTFAARHLALKLQLVDKPDGRKKHQGEVPLVGGIAIFSVLCLTFAILPYKDIIPWPLIIGMFVIMVMGALDDRFHIHAWIKFFVIIFTASFVVIFGELRLENLGNLFGFGAIDLGIFSNLFVIISLAMLMNAVNMMDGLDGLVGSVTFFVLFWVTFLFYFSGTYDHILPLTIIMASVLGFLVFNLRTPFRKRASVFLGDAGSLNLGLLLGWLAIYTAQNLPEKVEPVTIAWILAVPIIDACALFVFRLKNGRHPFDPDRNHLHHRFVDNGVLVGRAVLVIAGLVFLCGALGVFGPVLGIPVPVMMYLWAFLYFAYTASLFVSPLSLQGVSVDKGVKENPED